MGFSRLEEKFLHSDGSDERIDEKIQENPRIGWRKPWRR